MYLLIFLELEDGKREKERDGTKEGEVRVEQPVPKDFLEIKWAMKTHLIGP